MELSIPMNTYRITLASASPRRQELLGRLGFSFETDTVAVDETWPESLYGAGIADYLALLKANAYRELDENEILITADTIVWHDGGAMGKPKDEGEARQMLRSLSGTSHEVITSVCFTTLHRQKTVHEATKVWFAQLREEEIDHYIKNFNPMDKAGAYGIQEWIGLAAVEKIEGSYTNVVGLPTALVYRTLTELTIGK